MNKYNQHMNRAETLYTEGATSKGDLHKQHANIHYGLSRESFGGSFKDNIGSIKSSILMDQHGKIKAAWKREFDKHDKRRIHKSTLWRTGFYDDYIKLYNEYRTFKRRQGNKAIRGVPLKTLPKHLDRNFEVELMYAVEATFDTVDWLKGTENEQGILREFLEKHKGLRNDDVDFYDALVTWNEVLDDSVEKYKKMLEKRKVNER